MRNLLIIAMLIGGAFFAGWFTIERDGDRTRIEINRTEIGEDLSDLKQRGRDFLDERRVDRSTDEAQQFDNGNLDQTEYQDEGFRDYRDYPMSSETSSGFDQRSFNSADRFGTGYDDRR